MDLYLRITYTLLTLYMMLILLRWIGSALSLDFESRRWSWILRLTDPLIERLREALPNMGPFDFAPVAALFIVWFVRILSVRILENMAAPSGL